MYDTYFAFNKIFELFSKTKETGRKTKRIFKKEFIYF